MLKNKDEKIKPKGNMQFVIGIVLICLFVQIFVTEPEAKRMRQVGVWSILTVDSYRRAIRSGLTVGFHYVFNGHKYESGSHFDRHEIDRVGIRFFLQIDPCDPNKNLVHHQRVPSWFTLEAPPEGWPTKPTEDELREMMVQDSLKRGLKPMTSMTKRDDNYEKNL